MKKLFVSLFILSVLSACSEQTQKEETKQSPIEEESSSEKKEPKTYQVSFEEPFTADRVPADGRDYTKAKLTVSNYQIVQNVSSKQEDNDQYDYVQLDVVFENIGESESSNTALENQSFKFYDKNGLEIEVGYIFSGNLERDTYKQGKLRPGGKNEGTLYFPILKGSVPAEVIYKSNWISLLGSNEYVMKISQ
jgi:uncharacterized protein YxeA